MPEETDRRILVAMTRGRVIGRAGRLPWHLPEDLKLFRELTWGHSVIMGRRTFESIGRPLPGRHNVVLSRHLAPRHDLHVCRSFTEALASAAAATQRVFFIGGVEVYQRALTAADWLHVSWVRANWPGDTFFPYFDGHDWQVFETADYGTFRHVLYRRRTPQGLSSPRRGDSGFRTG